MADEHIRLVLFLAALTGVALWPISVGWLGLAMPAATLLHLYVWIFDGNEAWANDWES